MLNSTKLVLKASRSFKQNNIHLDVASNEINDGLKTLEINEIKSSTFSGRILASNERLEDWSEDEIGEGRPENWQAIPSPDLGDMTSSVGGCGG